MKASLDLIVFLVIGVTVFLAVTSRLPLPIVILGLLAAPYLWRRLRQINRGQ
jgi:hypothetical protein